MKDRELAIVDVETTGSRSTRDRIIEIGIVRFLNGEIVDSFSSLVDPKRPLEPFISCLTGIRDQELIEAPSFYDISDRVQGILEKATFVAHNVRFDYTFVRNEFLRIGVDFKAGRLCTVRLSRALYPRYKRHSLSAIINRFGFRCENRHRALDDALVVAEFLEYANTNLPASQINQTFLDLLQEYPKPSMHVSDFSASFELSV